MSKVTKGAELLFNIFGPPDTLGRLFNLESLTPKMQEIERKYELPSQNGHADGGALDFKSSLAHFLRSRKAIVQYASPFTGIDEYYTVVGTVGERVTFRYRVGVNKLPEVTAKFQIREGENEIRGEINLDVRHESTDAVRAFLTLICKIASSSKTFCIRQTGELWHISDPEVGILEVVCYQVGGVQPFMMARTFAEIESKDWKDPIEALATIECYEQGLDLSTYRCVKSIAEMFAPT